MLLLRLLLKALPCLSLAIPSAAFAMDSVSFSPDGKSILVVDVYPQVYEWSLTTGKLAQTFTRPADQAIDYSHVSEVAAYADNGTKVIVGQDKRTVVIFDHSGALLKTMTPEGVADEELNAPVNKLSITADATRAAGVLDQRVDIWDLKKGKLTQTIKTDFFVDAALFLDMGKKIAVTGYETIEVWDVKTAKKVRDFALKGSSDKAMLLSTDTKSIISGDEKGVVTVWTIKTGKVAQSWHVSDSEINALALSSDGKTLAIGEKSGKVQLWDIQAGNEIGVLSGHTDEVQSVAFSPDGTRIVSGSKDDTFRLWNVQNLNTIVIASLAWDDGWVTWTPDFAFVTSPGAAYSLFSKFDYETGKYTYRDENFADEKARPDLVEKALAQ